MEEAASREVVRLLATQSGVIARRQVEAAGGQAHDIARMLRRREWVRLLPGVYVDHTGNPTWAPARMGGVLYFAPAALADESAILAADPRPSHQRRARRSRSPSTAIDTCAHGRATGCVG